MNLQHLDNLTTPLAQRLPREPRDTTGLGERQRAFSDALGRAAPADESREDRARSAAESLVSVSLVQPILKQLRDSDHTAPPFAPGPGEKQFRALMDAELAHRLVGSERWALVDAVARKLLTRTPGGAPAPTDPPRHEPFSGLKHGG